MKLVAKSSTGSFTHDPMPAIVINHENRHYDSINALVETVVTWNIDGILVPKTMSIGAQVAQLTSFYKGGNLTLLNLTTDAGLVVDTIASQVVKGIVVESLTFPEGHGPEWATRRKYSLVISGVVVPQDVLLAGELEYSIAYNTLQSDQLRRTISGVMKDVAGGATAKYLTAKAAWDAWAPGDFDGSNRTTDTYTVNKEDTVLSFNLDDLAYWIAYPTDITDGDISKEIEVDSMGVGWCNISGWYEGAEADCDTALAGIAPSGYVLLTGTTTRNDHTNRTSFVRKYISTIAVTTFSSEMLSAKTQLYEFVHKKVLGGAVPIKQYTSRGPFKYTQTGQLKRRDTYPEPPGYNWNSSGLLSQSIVRIAPEFQVATGSWLYGLSYVYEFEFATSQGWSS